MVWGLLLIGLVAFVLIGSLLGFIASGSVRKLKAIVEKLLWTVAQLQNRLDEAEENLRSEGPEFAPKEAATDSLAELEQLVEEAPAAEPPPALPAQSYVPPVPETIPLVVPDSAHLIADPPEPAEAPPPEPETPILPSPPAQADSKQSAPRPLQAFLKRIGPKDSDMPWEMALGTYWLPRLGAIALSIAIGSATNDRGGVTLSRRRSVR